MVSNTYVCAVYKYKLIVLVKRPRYPLLNDLPIPKL